MGQPFNLSHEKMPLAVELRGRSRKHCPQEKNRKTRGRGVGSGRIRKSGAAKIGPQGTLVWTGVWRIRGTHTRNTSKIQSHRERLGKVSLTPDRTGPDQTPLTWTPGGHSKRTTSKGSMKSSQQTQRPKTGRLQATKEAHSTRQRE